MNLFNYFLKLSVKLSAFVTGSVLVLLMNSSVVNAEILYDQSAVDGDGFLANSVFVEPIADDFTVASDSSLESISWAGFYTDSSGGYASSTDVASFTDNFTVRILTDDGGSPSSLGSAGETILSGSLTRSATSSSSIYQDDIYTYDFVLDSAFSLSASETYYFSVIGSSLDYDWYWATNSYDTGTSWDALGTNWNSSQSDMAFSMSGTATNVPEASSFILFAIMLPLLLVARRRKIK